MSRWNYASRETVLKNVNTLALKEIERILWDQSSTTNEDKCNQIDGAIQLVSLIMQSIEEEEKAEEE